MIQEIFLKRAANIRKEFLSIQKEANNYERALNGFVKMIDNTSNNVEDFLERLNSNALSDPEKAKQDLLEIFVNLENEYNKTSSSIGNVEDKIEHLKKEELTLFRDIKQRYPELSDSQIKSEIQDYIHKLKLS
jgi:hypothetical protein